jgi:hypothetical protein
MPHIGLSLFVMPFGLQEADGNHKVELIPKDVQVRLSAAAVEADGESLDGFLRLARFHLVSEHVLRGVVLEGPPGVRLPVDGDCPIVAVRYCEKRVTAFLDGLFPDASVSEEFDLRGLVGAQSPDLAVFDEVSDDLPVSRKILCGSEK